MDNKVISFGAWIGIIGTCMAMILSYEKWNSIFWAAFHGMFAWFYVIYYYFQYGAQ